MFDRIALQLASLSCVLAMAMPFATVSTLAHAGMNEPMSSPPATLYHDLGERAGIQVFVNDLIDRAVVDPRIADTFKKAKLDHLKQSITDQICAVTGGPCRYEGPDMKEAHADMGLKKADFLALVDDLEQAMQAHGVPFSVQKQLLAILAPMHRDVVSHE